MKVEIKAVVCRLDGTQIYENRLVDESDLPTPTDPEPTADELLKILAGVSE